MPNRNIYLPGDERNYLKQLPRSVIDAGNLKRMFCHHDDTIIYLQLSVAKQIPGDLLCRIHKFPLGVILGNTRTIADFRKRFHWRNCIGRIANQSKNCSQCVQMNQLKSSILNTSLQDSSRTTSFSRENSQIDFMGPYATTRYKYVLTASNVFSKYLFVVTLTRVIASIAASTKVTIRFGNS